MLLSKQKKLDGSIPDMSVTIGMACAMSQLVVEKAEVSDILKSDTLWYLSEGTFLVLSCMLEQKGWLLHSTI